MSRPSPPGPAARTTTGVAHQSNTSDAIQPTLLTMAPLYPPRESHPGASGKIWFMTRAIYAVATMDTKGHEVQFVADEIRRAGGTAVTVDVGTQGPPVVKPDVARETVAGCHPGGRSSVLGKNDRG